MQRVVFFLASLMAGPAGLRGDDRILEGDLKKLQGRWYTESFAGHPASFHFKGRRLDVEGPELHGVMSVRIEEAARPEKRIDLEIEESRNLGVPGVVALGIYRFESDDRLRFCFCMHSERPSRYATIGPEQWSVELSRWGDAATRSPGRDVSPAAADSDAPLPAGWPGATAPGVIEVKSYPAYRSAIVRDKQARAMSSERMFFPLFNHITRQHIAMTAPVVMTYSPQLVEKTGAGGEASMEFLYSRPDQGTVGPGVGKVMVEDHPGGTYVCLGVQGKMDQDRMRQGVARLREWLRDNRGAWTEAGSPRQLGYHGPMTAERRRLWEIQIPIKPADTRREPGAQERKSD